MWGLTRILRHMAQMSFNLTWRTCLMLILYIQHHPPILLRVVLGSVMTTGAQARFQEGGAHRHTHRRQFHAVIVSVKCMRCAPCACREISPGMIWLMTNRRGTHCRAPRLDPHQSHHDWCRPRTQNVFGKWHFRPLVNAVRPCAGRSGDPLKFDTRRAITFFYRQCET